MTGEHGPLREVLDAASAPAAPFRQAVSEVAILLNPRYRTDCNSVLAYLSITVAGILCVRGVRIVRLASGKVIVAMPTRRIHDACPSCASRRINAGTRFCSWCGKGVDGRGPDSRADVCYPVDHECRQAVEQASLGALAQEEEVRRIQGQDYHRGWSVYRGPGLAWRTAPVGGYECPDE